MLTMTVDATCAAAFFNRGVLYELIKDENSALQDYTAVLQLQSSRYALWNRALLLLKHVYNTLPG